MKKHEDMPTSEHSGSDFVDGFEVIREGAF